MTTESDATSISEEIKMLCLEAAWELDALARILPDLVPNVDGAHGAHHAVRGISGRLLRLASVLMSGLGDDSVTGEDLSRIIYLNAGQG